jgi:hypothetical protein
MNAKHLLYTVALGATLLSLGACSKPAPTSPASATAAFSPATRAGIASMSAALSSSKWQGLDALAATPGGTAAASLHAWLGASAAGLATRLAQPSAVIIAGGIRGTTFVYDAASHHYVAAPARSGAPANGVRYILYAVNPLDHSVVAGTEIGYADLTDEGDSTANTATLHLQAVSNAVTFVDYRVGLVGAPDSAKVGVTGAFFDGAKHLTFDLQAQGAHSLVQDSQEVHAHLRVPEDAFELTSAARATSDLVHATQHVDDAITVNDHVIVVAADHAGDTAQASVGVDGRPFAQVNASSSAIVIVGADGKPLPADQRETLGQVFGMFDAVGAALTRLLAPVNVMFALVPKA